MIQDPSDRSTHAAYQTVNGHPAKVEAAGLSARSLYDVCFEIRKKVDRFLAQDPNTALLQNVQARVREAIGVVDEAFQRYERIRLADTKGTGLEKYPYRITAGKTVCEDVRLFSFGSMVEAPTNLCPTGLVLLIIILACLAHRSPKLNKDESSNPSSGLSDPMRFPEKFQAVYIVSPHPFSEIDDFVISSSTEYQLDVTRYELGMKQGLEAYLADHPDIKAIFVGTRRTDPHGEKLTHFDPTDGGWPDFMRVHPVIDWHYAEIWAFIRHLEIPYCPLYDQGYTSLGGTKDTQPNPNLKKQDKKGGFLPAYELVGDDEERLGRDR
ncbi:hypothetical protein O1611_g6276 [Lasiodiplodia mahajangana]|uniref:Uncharacterized protein n=1 Tax=Lasiodiplodia mahajangana TaxID=1108764 RepID=A0ACC2JIV9_9PEZI|nr:hypothetical protein O1611_g6276 [Lasiodiplodia mahajangana]